MWYYMIVVIVWEILIKNGKGIVSYLLVFNVLIFSGKYYN